MAEENTKSFEETLLEFEAQRKKTAVPCTVGIVGGILAIVGGAVLSAIGNNDTIRTVGVVLLIIGFIVTLISSAVLKKFTKRLRKEVSGIFLAREYPGFTFDESGGEPLETILRCGFFARPDRYIINNHLIASYGGVKISVCDYDFMRRHSDKNGTTYQTYAKGRFYNFDFKRDFKETVKVCEKSFMSGVTINSSLKKVETESIEFNKKFKTWASDPLTAFYILTPQIQLAIMDLEKSVKGQFYMEFMGGNLYVALNNCGDSFPISMHKPFSEEAFAPVLTILRFPKVIIDSLKLSGAKYTTDLEYTAGSSGNKKK